jgi:hypothetical protein
MVYTFFGDWFVGKENILLLIIKGLKVFLYYGLKTSKFKNKIKILKHT